MSDLVYRQAAIAAIKTWGLIDGLSEGQAIEILADEEKLPSVPPQKVCVAELKVEIDDIKDYIDKAIDAERWIPCRNHLPSLRDEMYLVSLAWGGVGTMEFKDTGWHNYGSLSPVPIETVTAWMPLPEPYKGEQE